MNTQHNKKATPISSPQTILGHRRSGDAVNDCDWIPGASIDVSIEPYVLRDPTIPFSQRFSVQNTSWFSIYDVLPYCDFGHMRMDGGADVSESELGVVKVLDLVPELALHSAISWDDEESANKVQHSWKDLSISIVVHYKVLLGFGRCKAIRFKVGIPAKPNAESGMNPNGIPG